MLGHTLLLLFLSFSAAQQAHGPRRIEEEPESIQGSGLLHQPKRARRSQVILAGGQLEEENIEGGGKRKENTPSIQLQLTDPTDGSIPAPNAEDGVGSTTIGADSVWSKLLEARYHPMCSSPPCSEVSDRR